MGWRGALLMIMRSSIYKWRVLCVCVCVCTRACVRACLYVHAWLRGVGHCACQCAHLHVHQ